MKKTKSQCEKENLKKTGETDSSARGQGLRRCPAPPAGLRAGKLRKKKKEDLRKKANLLATALIKKH